MVVVPGRAEGELRHVEGAEIEGADLSHAVSYTERVFATLLKASALVTRKVDIGLLNEHDARPHF